MPISKLQERQSVGTGGEHAEREAEIMEENAQIVNKTMRMRDFVMDRDQNELDKQQRAILQKLKGIQGRER